jgi:UDP-GlcNAc3NAcA epimerase
MKIVTILGARPQFIKAAPVSRTFSELGLTEVLVHTGQHYDPGMSDVFFEELSIPKPAHHLGVGSGTHGEQTGRMLAAIEAVLVDEKPNFVLVYGDTNSTMAGALAAAKLNIAILHVEAGLRSFNRRMPEEVNRIVTDSISTILFAPTETAVGHLRNEGVPQSRIHLVGDVMFDAMLMFGERARRLSGILAKLALTPQNFVLATIHRAENTDDPNLLAGIFKGLTALCGERPVVCPLHPRTAAALPLELKQAFTDAGGLLIAPLGFLDMVRLEQEACLIVTDSGGVQKEAFFHQVPCITLRGETEWSELVVAGWNRLLSPAQASELPRLAREAIGRRGQPIAPYGDGHAAGLIASVLQRYAASGAAPSK